jgi:ATP-binding cassette subfamily C (CFTR/MRP) protein 2
MVTGVGRSIRAGQAGLVLSYGLTLSGSLYYVVYNVLMIETSMVAAERLQSYASLPAEAQAALDEGKQTVQGGGSWPEHGAIQFHDVFVRYRPDLPHVLRGVSLSIAAQERVGVVGRTGSGKSTLVVGVLFRLVEPNHGHVAIDGVSTAGMNLSVRCCPSLRITVLAKGWDDSKPDLEVLWWRNDGNRGRFRCHNICSSSRYIGS